MSSILKALKKLEREKATWQPNELKVETEILRTDHSTNFSPLTVLLIALLLVVSGSGVTYIYMRQEKSERSSGKKTVTISEQNYISVPSVSDIKGERLPEAVLIAPAQAKAARVNKLSLPISKKTAISLVAPYLASREGKKTRPEFSNTKRQSESAQIVPKLRVNGIAYQNGDTESVAMINGTPFTSGSLVDGVKIEEIHKNDVIFNYNGEKFEIKIGQSNR